MSERVRNDDNLSCEVRLEEYLDIKRLIDEFGEPAYRAVRDYYRACGYEAGYDLTLALIKEGKLSKDRISSDPAGSLLLLMEEFFARRGGNQPILAHKGDDVTLTTKNSVFCPSPIAQRESGVQHKDVCNIHKRAFMEGFSRVLEEFVPGIQVQYTNVTSRSIDPEADCVELFRVHSPA
ncbi:hypothetical protein DRJ24_04370 [Candidatus Acetothermia bacterium]|nr:MAG: hypothetical protein DRJ24_04370 [Candidatus Acetothermia bacterium]